MSISVGDRVRKREGFPFPGIVVAVFKTTAGLDRAVVECDVPEVKGILHIYRMNQLEKED